MSLYRRHGFLSASRIQVHTLKQAHTFLPAFVRVNKCVLSNYPNGDYHFNDCKISRA